MKLLVTAGPTREFIDPVRFLSNRSSGKMGFAVAEVAAERGHEVILIAGPVALRTPAGVRRVDVVSARDMLGAVLAEVGGCDVLVMAAAVADWRPAEVAPHKLKKRDGLLALSLERTEDILSVLAQRGVACRVVGFAAETRAVTAEARRKLREKRLDLIVANDVSEADAGFEVDTNRVCLIDRDGEETALPLMPKRDVAARILERVERMGGRGHGER